MAYNLINLPAQIDSGSIMKAGYTYLSDGTKARALDASGVGYDYLGSFTYTHDANNNTTLESVAFGSRHANGLTTLSGNRWRFSGKEEQDTAFGIPYSDFGARLYDRTAWTAIDPLAEKYYNVSPYVYCHNNPVKLIDTDGRFVIPPFLIKMAVGAAVDLGMQITFNMAAGADLEDALNKVDWTSVGAAALLGPASSAKKGAKLFSYAITLTDAGLDISSDNGLEWFGGEKTEKKDVHKVAADAFFGIAASNIGGGMLKSIRKEFNALSKNASYMAPLTKAEKAAIRNRTLFVNSEGFEGFVQSLSHYTGGLIDKSVIELINEAFSSIDDDNMLLFSD